MKVLFNIERGFRASELMTLKLASEMATQRQKKKVIVGNIINFVGSDCECFPEIKDDNNFW